MQIEFNNGKILECLGVHSNQSTYQGVVRDCYTFLFDPEKVSLTEIEQQFTAENCGRLVLLTDNEISGTITNEETAETQVVTKTVTEQFVHEHYTMRVGYGYGLKEMAVSGGMGYGGNITEAPEAVNWVKMLQTTLAERSIESQQEVLDALVVEALAREV